MLNVLNLEVIGRLSSSFSQCVSCIRLSYSSMTCGPLYIILFLLHGMLTLRLGPAWDVHFFYAHYHLRSPQNRHANFTTSFSIFFKFNFPVHNLIFEFCTDYFWYKMGLQLCFKMRARFVSSVFCIFLKTAFSIFIYQKSSQILRGSIFSPLVNKGGIEK